MCGIFCSISRNHHVLPSDTLASRLQSRGPDSQATVNLTCSTGTDSVGSDVFITFHSTVLSLRGDSTVQQPYQDKAGNYTLCWNGEAWSIADKSVDNNDTEVVHSLLCDVLRPLSAKESLKSEDKVARALSTVAGPSAFLFFDHVRSVLYYGRDFLGRRSLLTKRNSSGDLLISSVSDGSIDPGWNEIETNGVHCIEFGKIDALFFRPASDHISTPGLGVTLSPYNFSSTSATSEELIRSVTPLLILNQDIPLSQPPLNEHSSSVTQLETLLLDSLMLRATNIPQPPSSPNTIAETEDARLAVLFSGGLDCTMLARMSHDLLPVSESIDLLNVAFENPRINRNRIKNTISDDEIYELCPDRITGRASHAELQQCCPGRKWRFVSINVTYTEFVAHREKVISLMHPHNTEMDLSIASALYFAARGQGQTSDPPMSYTTNARVLLSGLGADEIFAGYTRHATAFKHNGFAGLLEELQLDVGRLGTRNLGRDDRVMSHWGKEVRYPYLDERLLSWALTASVNEKCGFGELENNTPDSNDSSTLEPGKKVLRCLAWKLGMKNVARETKRAIQFGARTAKMETGKTKGTHLIS